MYIFHSLYGILSMCCAIFQAFPRISIWFYNVLVQHLFVTPEYLIIMYHWQLKTCQIVSNLLYVATFITCSFWVNQLIVVDNCINLLQVGPYYQDEVIICYCTHLSVFGATVFTTPIKMDPFSDISLFVTQSDKQLALLVVLSILIVYLHFLIWTLLIDKNMKKKVNYTFSYVLTMCVVIQYLLTLFIVFNYILNLLTLSISEVQ